MRPPQGLTLYCLECDWQIQVAEGTPVSALRSDCVVCKANIGIRSESMPLKKPQSESQAITPTPVILNKLGELPEDPPSFLRTLDNRVLDNLVDPGDSDEYFLIDSFVSRITPLILAAKVVADLKSKSMDDANQETDMETILNEFADQGVTLRNYIRKHEENLGIIGERASGKLSVGFPEEGSKSLKFFVNTFLGGEHGLAKKMGAIQEKNDEVELTTASKNLLNITVFERLSDVKMRKHGKGVREVYLPDWYNDKDVHMILTFIQERAQSEIAWMQDILGQASRPGGRTPREIMQWEYGILLEGKSERKWRYPAVAESNSDDDFDDDFYKQDKLANEIKNTLKGTLNRMKELGLLYSFKKGRQTYYRPTDLGSHWIQEWDREDS